MTRLAAEARLQFYALPEPIIPLIASYISAPNGGRAFDPCAGEGVAIGQICEQLGIPKGMRYLNELHNERAARCVQWTSNAVLLCDAIKTLQVGREHFQLAYLNPPFGTDSAEEGRGRLEEKFFVRWLQDAPAVQPGAVVIYVAPQYVFASVGVVKHIARMFDDVLLAQHPEAYRRFGEAVMIAILRTAPRTGTELRAEVQRVTALLDGELPLLALQPTPRYTVPAPRPVRRVIWQDARRSTTAQAQLDVIATGGAWASKKYQAASRVEQTRLQPVFPLQVNQAALRIAAGAINGTTIAIDGVPMVIKGTTKARVKRTVETITDGDTQVSEERRIVQAAPHVTAVNEQTGAISFYLGDAGLRKLMADPHTAQALLDAVEASAPPKYRLEMDARVAAILADIRPISGRHLPGYPPGLLAMQRHAAAAMLTTLTTPDPGWGGAIPKGAILGADLGCGKTTIGMAIAELLRLCGEKRGSS